MRKIVKFLFAILLMTSLVVEGLVISGAFYKPQKSDALMVLGSKVENGFPESMLQARLDKAIELYKIGYGRKIIVTGGQGENEDIPEGAAMRNYLVGKGIDAGEILVEDKSTSTYENFKLSKPIIDEHGFREIVVVTSNFHLFRSLWTAKKFGIDATGAPSEISGIDYINFIREVAAIYRYALYK